MRKAVFALLIGGVTGCIRAGDTEADSAGDAPTGIGTDAGLDTCEPPCGGVQCGDDGCGEQCGPCPAARCDGLVFTPGQACVLGACVGDTTPQTCSDAEPCTLDACNPRLGCTSKAAPDGTVCTAATCKGLLWVKAATCVSGACTGGGGTQECADANPCTEDACAGATGCTFTPRTGPCDDNDPCTPADVCVAGQCEGEGVESCEDEEPCTVDTCVPGEGCVHDPVVNGTACGDAACDGLWFTPAKACSGGTCTADAPVACDDADPCTSDACDPAAGCLHVYTPSDECDTCPLGTFDPLWAPTKLLASDGAASGGFGGAVALDGDRAVIGAPGGVGFGPGAAYVFERQADGSWAEQAKLLASGGAARDGFGASVSVSGDRVVVGAHWKEDFDPGYACVFELDAGGTWVQKAVLEYGGDDGFGHSVSVWGDRIAVAALHDRTHVFERQADGSWTMTATVPVFGSWSVSLEGDRLLVGSRDFSLVVERQGDGSWVQVAKLPATDTQAKGEEFGRTVALSGDLAVVGAPWADGEPTDDTWSTGAAYVFERQSDGSWKQIARLLLPDRRNDDLFGTWVSLSGDRLAVGTPWRASGGFATLFERQADGGWSLAARPRAPDDPPPPNDWFNAFGGLAISGDRVLVGLSWDDSARVFERVGGCAGTCESQCDACFDEHTCTRCDPGLFVVHGDCVADCPAAGAFVGDDSGTSPVCVACPQDCFACADADTCTHCSPFSLTAKLRSPTYSHPWSGGLGRSVSVSGDRVVAGEQFSNDPPGVGGATNTGLAHVYDRQADGAWAEVAVLGEPVEAHEADWFADEVSVSGDLIAVGWAVGVVLFRRTADGSWPEVAHLKGGVGLGSSVSVDGSRVAGGTRGVGSAWVFEEKGGTWVGKALPGGASNARVSLSGDRLAVGGYDYEGTGAVQLFERQADGSWIEGKKIANPWTSCCFGGRVSLSGDRLAATAKVAGVPDVVHIFDREADGNWVKRATLAPVNDAPVTLGTVALSGDRLVLGSDEGPVFAFMRMEDGTWAQVARLRQDDQLPFGGPVAISGDRVVVGNRRYVLKGERGGAALVYDWVGPCGGSCETNCNWCTFPDACTGCAAGFLLQDGDCVAD